MDALQIMQFKEVHLEFLVNAYENVLNLVLFCLSFIHFFVNNQ